MRYPRARVVLQAEAAALTALAARADLQPLDDAVGLVVQSSGVIVTGVGKAGIIGQKFSSTLASVGFPGFFLHPTEALHGDLGRLRPGDLVVVLSWSGRSDELVQLLPAVRARGHQVLLLTGDPESPLTRLADTVVSLGPAAEACPLGLAPSVSTTLLLAASDAIALAAMESRGFMAEDYAALHPGGALGRSLRRIPSLMRGLEHTATVAPQDTLRATLSAITARRTGAAFIVAADGSLSGVFTDGDLRRHIEAGGAIDVQVQTVMTAPGLRVQHDTPLRDALELLRRHRIGELPVLDGARLLGHLNSKDLVAGRFLDE